MIQDDTHLIASALSDKFYKTIVFVLRATKVVLRHFQSYHIMVKTRCI